MRKKFSFVCLLLSSALIFGTAVITIPTEAQAYTEEEKAQAKAWLSGHGYPPTEAGANQAYSDYQNGMWQEEAIANGLPATTGATDSTTQSGQTPAATEAQNSQNASENENPIRNTEEMDEGSKGQEEKGENSQGTSVEIENEAGVDQQIGEGVNANPANETEQSAFQNENHGTQDDREAENATNTDEKTEKNEVLLNDTEESIKQIKMDDSEMMPSVGETENRNIETESSEIDSTETMIDPVMQRRTRQSGILMMEMFGLAAVAQLIRKYTK